MPTTVRWYAFRTEVHDAMTSATRKLRRAIGVHCATPCSTGSNRAGATDHAHHCPAAHAARNVTAATRPIANTTLVVDTESTVEPSFRAGFQRRSGVPGSRVPG